MKEEKEKKKSACCADSAEVNVSNENEKQITANENKCSECGFVGNTQVSLKKHVNTKHAPLNKETRNIEENTMLQDIDDNYQVEILHSEQVYACNICDEGCDTEDEVKKQISVNHKDVLIEISEKINEDRDADDETCLARYDNDGNFIG